MLSLSLRSLLVIGAAAFCSASALAQEVDFFHPDFCDHPIETACKNLSMNQDARARRLQDRRKSYAQTALNLTIRKHGLDASRVKAITDIDKLGLRFIDRLSVYETYNSYLNTLSTVINSVESQARLADHVQAVKRLLLQAIDAEFSPAKRASKAINAKMKKEVNRTKIVLQGDLPELAKKKPAHAQELREQFAQGCGADGLGQNAFAYLSNDQSTKYLAICTGWLLASSGDLYDARTNLENLVLVLGHEWGHHIDSAYFFDQYLDFGNCMLDHYSQNLMPLDLDALDPAFRATLDPKTNWNDPLVKTEWHLREMAADLWGARVLSQYLLWNGLTWDSLRKANVLREGFGGLCGTQDEGIHPTGDFRALVLLGQEPALRKAMGCKTVKTGYACTFKGLE